MKRFPAFFAEREGPYEYQRNLLMFLLSTAGFFEPKKNTRKTGPCF